jgi:hypothetical protein
MTPYIFTWYYFSSSSSYNAGYEHDTQLRVRSCVTRELVDIMAAIKSGMSTAVAGCSSGTGLALAAGGDTDGEFPKRQV